MSHRLNPRYIECFLDSYIVSMPMDLSSFLLVNWDSSDLDAFELLLSNSADVEHQSEEGITVREYVEAIAHGDDVGLLEVLEKY